MFYPLEQSDRSGHVGKMPTEYVPLWDLVSSLIHLL